jgi:hypothetical protein
VDQFVMEIAEVLHRVGAAHIFFVLPELREAIIEENEDHLHERLRFATFSWHKPLLWD